VQGMLLMSHNRETLTQTYAEAYTLSPTPLLYSEAVLRVLYNRKIQSSWEGVRGMTFCRKKVSLTKPAFESERPPHPGRSEIQPKCHITFFSLPPPPGLP